tara:strand:+ start:218 stop:697 length:480 start_codon:yes stop_codon:yes gene_type:complete
MTIRSFKGQIAANGVDTISLHTNTGKTGYRIIKFSVFPQKPGDSTAENLVQIFTIESSATIAADAAVATNIDFSDNTLLAVGFVGASTNSTQLAPIPSVIFDNMKFNQDIFIAHKDESGNSAPVNYYIELELSTLSLDENTTATLKDIKNIEGSNLILD